MALNCKKPPVEIPAPSASSSEAEDSSSSGKEEQQQEPPQTLKPQQQQQQDVDDEDDDDDEESDEPEKAAAAAAATVTPSSEKPQSESESEDDDDEESDSEEDGMAIKLSSVSDFAGSSFPRLSASLESQVSTYLPMTAVDPKEFAKNMVLKFEKKKAKELEEKWKEYSLMESQLYVKRLKLMSKLSDVLLDVLKPSNN